MSERGEGRAPAAEAVAGAARLADAVRAKARALGFDLVGITAPEPTEHLAFFRGWLDRGFHGEMRYLARRDAVARRGALEKTLPAVRSVVVVGHGHYQEDPDGVPLDPARGVFARYARGRDYHRVVKKKLQTLGRWLEDEATGDVAWRAYVDTGPLLERDLARRAGLGWFGRNTMLIHPRRGSYFFLGVLLTDVALAWDEPFTADHCGSCTACIDACPTGALLGRDPEGAPVMDARRCISYLTIEHRGAILEELRPLVGNRVYGCDVCQEVCPWNQRFAEVGNERDYAAREAWEAEWDSDPDDDGSNEAVIPTTDGPALVDLMRMSEDEWDAFTRGSAIRRAGYAGLRRNVAIALGNWLAERDTPDPEAVGLLVAALSDDDPAVGGAAAWALGRARTQR